jgi:hypothetical protein
VDVCHKPYKEFVDAMKATTDVMYEVADGTVKPFNEKTEYAVKIFY